MFIITAKLSKKKIAAACALVCAAVCALVLLLPRGDARAAIAASTEQERGQYLKSLGYEAVQSEQKQVKLPASFDEGYEKYNELQKQCGFDLKPYRGKTVTLYTYSVLNYGDGSQNVLCDVLVYRDRVIGGAVYTAAIDGFMHGLRAQ